MAHILYIYTYIRRHTYSPNVALATIGSRVFSVTQTVRHRTAFFAMHKIGVYFGKIKYRHRCLANNTYVGLSIWGSAANFLQLYCKIRLQTMGGWSLQC